MKFTPSIGLLLAARSLAAPTELETRAKVSDIDILNVALTLEHLEDAFYKEALKKFPESQFKKQGYLARTRGNIQEIGSDESEHVKFLTSTIKSLKSKPVKACKYDFGLTDLDTFIQTAQVLEGVGVSAYLGAAALINNKAYLTPAASILTVEARHNAYISDNQPKPASPFPAPFDVPITLDDAYTLASPFIKSCPKSNPALPVKAFPALTLPSSEKQINKAGSNIILNVESSKSGKGMGKGGKMGDAEVIDMADKGKKLHAAFLQVTGPVFTNVKSMNGGKQVKIAVPKSIAGQSYIVLTHSNDTVTDANTLAFGAVAISSD